ncbi:hypothetical protein AB6G46_24305 [Providencia hangzhouensis]|uniref:hypothetical protein n=1 Tax=Providencia hangzhouensis TaxID=3031799 RepID=UPI0034DD0611
MRFDTLLSLPSQQSTGLISSSTLIYKRTAIPFSDRAKISHLIQADLEPFLNERSNVRLIAVDTKI